MHIVYTCLCIMYKYTCYLFKFAKKKLFKKRENERETWRKHAMPLSYRSIACWIVPCSRRTRHSTRPGPWEQLQWKTQITQYHIYFSIVHENQFFYWNRLPVYPLRIWENESQSGCCMKICKLTVYVYQNCMKYLRNIYFSKHSYCTPWKHDVSGL